MVRNKVQTRAAVAIGTIVLVAIVAVAAVTSIAAPRTALRAAVNLGAGATFQECRDCPAMVVIAPGSGIMGFDGGEKDRYEGPVRHIHIRKHFAAGRTEVTNAQYAAFVAATGRPSGKGCNVWIAAAKSIKRVDTLSWRDPGYGRPPLDDEPVVCVSWNDAQAYVEWLRQQTHQPYRLLTETEWEYVARAGSTSHFAWGDDPEQACLTANVFDASAADPLTPWPSTRCNDGHVSVAKVGSYPPNAFGLYDVIGNVWEWVQDCYQMPYPSRPVDGSAQLTVGCDRHGVRGGSWRTEIKRQTPSFRGRDDPGLVSNIFGLRVARDLP